MKLTKMQESRLKAYDEHTKKEILSMLKSYGSVVIVKDRWGKGVEVQTFNILQNVYDTVFLETISVNEVYTEDEQILNYIHEFRSFPINYKGKRDYSLIDAIFEEQANQRKFSLVFDENKNIRLIKSR